MTNEYRCSNYEILEAMHRYGGGFVKQLAVLYRLADRDNQEKLASTFWHYFRQYDEMAAMTREEAPDA
jgi:hypothetical protein